MSTKISQLTSATDITASDLMQIVDVEDGVMAPSGTNKKATAQLVANNLAKIVNDGAVITANTSTDAVRVTQTGSGNALVVEDSTNPDSTPLVVTNNGKLVVGKELPIGIYNPYTAGLIYSWSQIVGDSTDRASLSIVQDQLNAAGPTLFFAKSRENIAAAANDISGSINFQAHDGSRFVQSAAIHAFVEAAPTTGSAPGFLSFQTTVNGGTSPAERMRITSAGNVGIGTGTPTEKLDVAGNIKASQLYINNPSGDSSIEVGGAGNVYIDLKKPNSDDRDLRITTDGTDSIIDSNGGLLISTANNERMRITSAGNVGIGTATPSSKLHVVGDLTVSSATTATSATAGTNGDVPAQVAGYLVVNINGFPFKIPYYPA